MDWASSDAACHATVWDSVVAISTETPTGDASVTNTILPSVTRRVIEQFGTVRATTPHPRLGELTEREREIVGWVATGRSNQEIAEELVVSPDTCAPM